MMIVTHLMTALNLAGLVLALWGRDWLVAAICGTGAAFGLTLFF